MDAKKDTIAYDVFISYRRKGGFDTAKHIFDLLIRDGYSVSFDCDTLRNGDFDTELLNRIEKCKDFILILNPGAFDRSLDPSFDRNNDWMRIEIAKALEKKKNIIPIRLEGFDVFPENLPADIINVRRKNGPKYSQDYFDAFYKNLKENFMLSKPKNDVKFTVANPWKDPLRAVKNIWLNNDQSKDAKEELKTNGSSEKNNHKEENERDRESISKNESEDSKTKSFSKSESDGQSNKSINNALELGKAIERGAPTIIVEGDLASLVIKIMSITSSKWIIAGGSIVVAIVAILAMPMVTFIGPLGLVTEGLVLSVGGVGAIGILGVTATEAAVSIGIGAKNKNAVNKLRKEYSLNKVDDNKIILIRK